MNVLIESSIRATLIALAIAAVVGGFRIRSATARHRAWLGVLLAMVLLPAISLWGPKATLHVLPAADISQIELPSPLAPEFVQPASAPPPDRILPATPQPTHSQADWFLIAYASVAGALLFRLLLGTFRAVDLRRRALQESDFLVSSHVSSAIAIGWWKPAVILPPSLREWPQAELDAVLSHEREHCHRRDPLVQWIAALNRCIFWFHPLAWWLEKHLAALAEEACDSAAILRGHDPRDYSEYLIRQARAIQQSGRRIAMQGVAMGDGSLGKRIRRVLAFRPARKISRITAIAATAACAVSIFAISACVLVSRDKPLPGQPTMNDLMHRRTEGYKKQNDEEQALRQRAQSLTKDQVTELIADFQTHPDNEKTYWTLVRHYQLTGNTRGLTDLYLWIIEYQPAGRIAPGNILRSWDPSDYERGKALWLANLKKPNAPAEIYERAADYFQAPDGPLAESILVDAQRAYPRRSFAASLGRVYASALLNLKEEIQGNVAVASNVATVESSFGKHVLQQLDSSNDASLLASTAERLQQWGQLYGTRQFINAKTSGRRPLFPFDPLPLARSYVERAAAIDPNSEIAVTVQFRIAQNEYRRRLQQLNPIPPTEPAKATDNDRILSALGDVRNVWFNGYLSEAAAKAQDLLNLANGHQREPAYGDAIFEGNLVLGKDALHRGQKRQAVNYLMAAAEAPPTLWIRGGQFDMNLPRALVDSGVRAPVADFYERMAQKTVRTKQFQDWASDIRKGINPDLIPTGSSQHCMNDPC